MIVTVTYSKRFICCERYMVVITRVGKYKIHVFLIIIIIRIINNTQNPTE